MIPKWRYADAVGAVVQRDWPDGTSESRLTAAAGLTETPDPFVPPAPPTLDEVYDQAIQTQRVLKALVLALNDGTFQVGTNKTGAQLKAIIKAKM